MSDELNNELKLNHKHILVRAHVSNPPSSPRKLNKWLKQLVKDVGMKVMMGPHSKYLDVKGNRGITGMVVIETSHSSIHIWDETTPALVQMDLYSCADFKEETVINRLKDFGLLGYEFFVVDRNKRLKLYRRDYMYSGNVII